ncbi:MAG: hypothetical protein ACRCXZ_04270 [Patescibacteria group bacterium]
MVVTNSLSSAQKEVFQTLEQILREKTNRKIIPMVCTAKQVHTFLGHMSIKEIYQHINDLVEMGLVKSTPDTRNNDKKVITSVLDHF